MMDSSRNNSITPNEEKDMDHTTSDCDWRTQFPSDSRHKIVNKIMEELERHLSEDVILQVKQIAECFEEKVFSAATSQDEYILQVNMHLINLENIPHTSGEVKLLPSSSSFANQTPQDPGQAQRQLYSVAKSSPVPSSNSSQVQKQISSHNMQNIIASTGEQSATFPSVPQSGRTQTETSSLNSVGQSLNILNMSESSDCHSGSQCLRFRSISNSPDQMEGRQDIQEIVSQQQYQNVQQNTYHKQLQNLKNTHYGNNQPLLTESHAHQNQQQENISQLAQVCSSQQSHMQALNGHQLSQPTLQKAQPSLMHSVPNSDDEQNQQSSLQKYVPHSLQQPPSAILQHQQLLQQSVFQQKTPMTPQSMLSSHQNQQQIGDYLNETNVHQNHLIGHSYNVTDMQQQQQQEKQQWLVQEQNNLSTMQQQQFLGQKKDISNFHQQQLGPQHNVCGRFQHSMNTLQQDKIIKELQKRQQTLSTSILAQGQRSQSQLSPQQVMYQLQMRQTQLQKQLGSQNRPIPLQSDINPKVHASNQLIQSQNSIEQQKQLFQLQRRPEASLTSDSLGPSGQTNVVDGRDVIYQKMKSMKEMYMPPLMGIYKKFIFLQQNARVQITNSGQMDLHQQHRLWLESTLRMFERFPNNIPPNLTEEKLLPLERQIIDFIKMNRTRRTTYSHQQGKQQLHPSGVHSPQTQTTQLQYTDNQMSTLMQAKNLNTSVTTMQPNAVVSLPHHSMPSLSSPLGVRAIQPNFVNTLQTSSDWDSMHGNSPSSLQQGAVGSSQKVSMNSTHARKNMSSQNNMNDLKPNTKSPQLYSNTLNHQHLNQQFHQSQLSHQVIQKQQEKQIIQQQHQQKLLQPKPRQPKLQQSTQIVAHPIPHPCQMSEANELQEKQIMNLKLGILPQHQTTGRELAYNQPSLKSGAVFHIASPQPLPSTPPHTSQHSSPQTDQQSRISSSLSKSGTPLQPASSPLFSLSPTSMAPSPMPSDHEKQTSSISSHSNTGNGGQKKTVNSGPRSQSLVIGSPGISASPLLAEFASPENNQGPVSTVISDKTTETEKPIERLIKVVKSMSHKALASSVSDIYSAVSISDRIAGSKPGDHSKAAVGEDLVAKAKRRMLADKFSPEIEIITRNNMKSHSTGMPLTGLSSGGSGKDSFKIFYGMETSELESTATSRIKRPRIEANQALLKELKEINHQLIDTIVDISEEDNTLTAVVSEVRQGTIVKCSFSALTHSQNRTFPILPICLLVSSNYPNCSPILLDKLPHEVSKEREDLLEKARSQFSRYLRCLSQPMSLKEMARSWDTCARAVILEYSVQNGGGSFSTRYGTWETV